MKKYALIKSFTIFSMLTFILTGIVLSYFISDHIKKDKYTALIQATNFTIDSLINSNLEKKDFNDIIQLPKKMS